jgi:hypothetical protein
MADGTLPVIVHWEETLHDMLRRTAKFPKHIRFTLSGRIDNLALDVYERLVEARYTRDKVAILRRVNLDLEKLRLLLRLCHDEKHLDHRGFEHLVRNIDTAGRMIGGWIKERQAE